jgi:hypothetical protein
MLFLWWRMEEEEQRRVWLLYGWFTGLILCGSCFGAVAWAAQMMKLVNSFEGEDMARTKGKLDPAQAIALAAVANRWDAVFEVTYAIEFLFLSSANLLVLDRMVEFFGAKQRWNAVRRIVMAVVVLGSFVGLVANVVAAVHFQRAADASDTSSAFLADGLEAQSLPYAETSRREVRLALSIVSVQSFCEVAVLLFIVAAFVVTGVLCARYVRSRLVGVDAASAAAAAGRNAWLQIVGTSAFVFVTFLLRSVFSIMSAVTNQFQNVDDICRVKEEDTACNLACHSLYDLMHQWMVRTPEFQATIVLISSPLTLLVALWGMTSKYALLLMRTSGGRKNFPKKSSFDLDAHRTHFNSPTTSSSPRDRLTS